jgi:hypothetical protein
VKRPILTALAGVSLSSCRRSIVARSKPSTDVRASRGRGHLLTADQAAQHGRFVALLRLRLTLAHSELDEIHRELVALWGERQLVAALVDREPRLAKKLGLLATRLEAVERRPTTRAVSQVVAPLVTRALAFAPGRRLGALDALDRVLVKILEADRRMKPDDVLEALKARAGHDGVIVGVRKGWPKRAPQSGAKRIKGPLVGWLHPQKGEQLTAWSSIRARRLPRLRALLLAKPQ